MKYKILMYDGRPVRYVTSERIVFSDDKDTTILYPIETTIELLANTHRLAGELVDRFQANIRKCDLEEVELRFTKQI